MKQRIRHRKLFYVPGMISLLLIPVLCLWFIKYNRYLNKDYSVSISLTESYMIPDTSKVNEFIPIYPKRKIENYIFNGDFKSDNLQLKKVRERIKKLYKDNDSINAVKILFGKRMKYKTYVNILDGLFIDKVPSFVINSNFIYVVNFPPKHKKHNLKISNLMKCGYGSANEDYWAEQARKKALKLFIKNIKQFWQIPVALLGIIILNIYTLIKFNKNSKYNQKSYI
jgi:hypothetical protein